MKTLDERDIAALPTVYAKCDNCDKHYPGARPGRYYGSSFTDRQWKRNPVCENCKGSLTIVRRVNIE